MNPWTQLILVFHLGSCYWTHLRQKYSSSSGSAFRDLQPPLLELLEPRLCIVWFCCCLFLVEVFLYFNRRINMITKATKSKVTTTPMRIPKTGVNSNGTGDSEKGKKQQCKVVVRSSRCPLTSFFWLLSLQKMYDLFCNILILKYLFKVIFHGLERLPKTRPWLQPKSLYISPTITYVASQLNVCF